jgi:hypothetical protein
MESTDDFGEVDVASRAPRRTLARPREAWLVAVPGDLSPRDPRRESLLSQAGITALAAGPLEVASLEPSFPGLLGPSCESASSVSSRGAFARDGSREVLDPSRLRPASRSCRPRRVGEPSFDVAPGVPEGGAGLPEVLALPVRVVRIPFQSVAATGWVPVSRSLPSCGSPAGVPAPSGVRFRASCPGRSVCVVLADHRRLS